MHLLDSGPMGVGDLGLVPCILGPGAMGLGDLAIVLDRLIISLTS